MFCPLRAFFLLAFTLAQPRPGGGGGHGLAGAGHRALSPSPHLRHRPCLWVQCAPARPPVALGAALGAGRVLCCSSAPHGHIPVPPSPCSPPATPRPVDAL